MFDELGKSSQDYDPFLTFDQILDKSSKLEGKKGASRAKVTKTDATETFLDLLVFAQAGFCDLRQQMPKDHFCTKFHSI